MNARRMVRWACERGFAATLIWATCAALALSTTSAAAQDKGALTGTPQAEPPESETPPKSEGKPKSTDDPKDDQEKEAIRSINELLGEPQAGTPGETGQPSALGKKRERPKRPTRAETPDPDAAAPQNEEQIPSAEAVGNEDAANGEVADDAPLPPEQREYSFAIKDGTFEQLLDAWSRQTGMGVIGKAPSGKVTFVSDEKLSFREALKRIRTLLFKQEELSEQWLIYHEEEGFFEVKPVNEMRRYIPTDRRFSTIDAFLEADVDPEELVYVVYHPKRAVADLQNVMDHMPLYVLIAPYANTNTQTILALAKDVHKYLDLVDFLGETKHDPRTIAQLELQHVLPSVAVEKLHTLMDIGGDSGASPRGASRRPRAARRGAESIVDIPEPDVSLLPDDAMGVILVRAMQDTIEEIKSLLPYIDVDPGSSTPAVVIEVEHADVTGLVSTIQAILKASAGEGGAAPTPRSRRRRVATKGAKPNAPAPVSADDITLIPLPDTSQIIVVADEVGVARVRELVAQFDVRDDVRHRFALMHASPEEAIEQINVLLALAETGVQLVADPRGDAIWYVGPPAMLARVEGVIPEVDVAGDPIELFSYRPVNQAPTFIANMLREYIASGQTDGKQAKPTPRRGRRTRSRGRSTPVTPGQFTADDEGGTLWVWCTKIEWDEYLPLIEQLDDEKAEQPRITWLRPERLASQEAADLLAQLAPMPEVVLLPTPDGILVSGATESEIAELEMLMAEIDRAEDRVQRTFTLKHADPAEMVKLLQGVVSSSPETKSRRGGRRVVRKGKKDEPTVTSSESEDLEVYTYGRQIIVSTTASMMTEVERIIEEFDVRQMTTETRSYDFPPGTNLANIVGQLQGWLTVGRPKGDPTPVMIPRQASRVLVVIAEPTQFPRIEELIDVIDDEPDVPQRITDYIPVKYVSAGELIDTIEPLLEISISNLVAEGVLTESVDEATPPDPRNRRGRRQSVRGSDDPTSGLLTMMADERNHRIVIVAPEPIIDEAKALVAQFDLDGAGPVHKRITLRRAEPAAIVAAVKELMGQATGPRTPRRRAQTDGATESDDVSFTIIEAPGGGAVVAYGMPDDVAQAETWIAELDNEASGREIKLFTFSVVSDIKSVADVIMNTLEAPSPRAPAGRPRGGRGRGGQQEEDPFAITDSWETTFTRIGSDIYLKGDEIAGTMLAVASATKMARITEIVEQFEPTDGSEPPISVTSTEYVPFMTYELQNVGSITAEMNLEDYFSVMWRPRDKRPDVQALLFGDTLIVEYPDETRFDEIRQIIAERIDVVDELDRMPKTIQIAVPEGIDPKDAAMWLQLHYPDVPIDIEEVEAEIDYEELVPRVRPAPVKRASNPCVLPSSYRAMLDGLAALATVQDPPPDPDPQPDDPEDEPPVEIDEPTGADPPGAGLRNFVRPSEPRRAPKGGDKRKLRFVVDPVHGVITVRGETRDVEEIKDLEAEMKEQLGNTEESGRPDIRVYRVRYISVHDAAAIIDDVFNATRREQAQLRAQQLAQQRAARQRAAQQRRQQQQQQQGRQQGQPGGEQDPRNRGGNDDNQQDMQTPQLPGGVRIVPNPRDRTLIMKANTSDYPAILELLATIDQPQPYDLDRRTFQLERLNAEEVTTQLKEMLGIDEQSRRRTTRSSRNQGQGGASSAGAEGGLPETIMVPTIGGEVVQLNPEDFKLLANPVANTIFAMAPTAGLDYVETLIEQMEGHEAPQRDTRHFELDFADATATAEYINSYFAEGRGPSSPFATPTVLPYPELNMVTVQASAEQMLEVEGLIETVDVQRESGQFESIAVTTDAKHVADLLAAMYSTGGPQRNRNRETNKPTFIGEEGGSILFFSAPDALREEILTRIDEIEAQDSDRTKPRKIQLTVAKASDVATVIEEAYGASGRSRRGRSTTTFTIVPHDASRRLFVTKADDATFEEIESLAKELDQSTDMGFEFRIYRFKHASAKKMYDMLSKMVRDYMQRDRDASIEPFSAEVDEKANALVVMGSPRIHEFLGKNLFMVDVPENATSPPGFLMVALKNADAAEVAGNINRLWNEKQLPAGDKPPQAEANRSLNVLVVKGTQAQIDEIKTQFIDPLEENQVGDLVHHYQLKLADAQEVASALNGVYNSGRRRGGNDQRIQVIPDAASNQLIVLANDAEYKEVEELIKTLDVEPASASAREMRSFRLRYADPWGTQNAINNMFRSFSRNPKDQVIAVPEWGSSSVIVSASKEKMAEVETLIEQLDQGTTDKPVEIIPIKRADPGEVARALDVIYVRSAPRTRNVEQPITISEVPGSQAIMVKADEENMSRIKATIAELDTENEEMGGEIRVIPLLKSDANEVMQVMQEYLRKPGTGGRRGGGDLMGDVRLSALAEGNAIVVSGDPAEVERIESVIKGIDETGEMGRSPQVIRLQHADAVQLLPTLEQMFEEQSRGRGRGRGASQQPPVIVANETLNALLVRAGAADYAAIEDIVRLLDTEEAREGGQVKIIKVQAGVNITDMAEMIEDQINATIEAASTGNQRGRRQERISIRPDTRTRSLLVAGASAYFNEVERLVRELEQTGPSGDVHTAVIRTVNLKAEEVRDLIERLKEENGGSGGSSRGSNRGSRRRR